MKPTLMIALFAMAAMTVAPSAAQTKKKGAGEPSLSRQKADPLTSFRQIAKKFEEFFAGGPQKLIEKQRFEKSPNGEVVSLKAYSGRDVAYDVQKTSSLVSPYAATINVKLVGRDNASCGDVRGSGDKAYGWTTVSAALAASERAECFQWHPIEERPTVYDVNFVFAYQDGRWIFKDAIRTKYSDRWELFLSIFGNAAYPVTQFSEPEARALNGAWRNLVQE